MGWSIGLIDNTVEITPQCAADLWAAVEDGDNPWYEPEYVAEEGRLTFNSDHMEHMDYMWNTAIQKVLLQHQVNGDITFGSMEGDNRGSFWGYRFVNGVMSSLEGAVVYKVVSQ